MENSSETFTLTAPYDELSCSGWKSVRDISFPLTVFSATVNMLMCVLTAGGCSLLIAVILMCQQLRRIPSNLLLGSLAASDLMIGLLLQPFNSAMVVCALSTDGSPSLPELIPKYIRVYIESVLVHLSCLNIVAITLDRYLCITYPFQYHDKVTKSKVFMALVVNWAVSVTLPLLRFVPSFSMTAIRILQIFVISSVLFIVMFCYMKIFRIAQRHKKQIICQMQAASQGLREQEFKSANTVFIVVAAVILCYTPLLVAQFLCIFNPLYDRLKIVKRFAITSCLLQSSLNPIIIFYRSRKFRRFAKRLLKCKVKFATVYSITRTQ